MCGQNKSGVRLRPRPGQISPTTKHTCVLPPEHLYLNFP